MAIRRILISGDEDAHAKVVSAALEGTSETPLTVDYISISTDVVTQCLSQDYDAMLLYLPQPVARGFQLLEQLQRNLPALPVVVISPSEDEDLEARFLLHGAQDFLARDDANAYAIHRTLRFAKLRKQHTHSNRSQRGYEHQPPPRDSLTGLPGRAAFINSSDQALRYCGSRRHKAALLTVDLDGFSAVLRELGIGVGDRLLANLAERLKGLLPSTALVGHFGGSVFAVAVPSVRNTKDAVRVAHSIIGAVAQPTVLDGRGIVIGARIGIAMFPKHSDNINTLLQQADQAMVQDRSTKRNAYTIYQPPSAAP